MTAVISHGITTNTPLPARDGSYIVLVELHGQTHACRMLSYVQGDIMAAGPQVL